MKMYKVNLFKNSIRSVIVDRKTDKSVWINERRFYRYSGAENYYDTFGEAKGALIDRLHMHLNIYDKKAKRIESELMLALKINEEDI